MRKMEERMDEKESKVVDMVRKVEDKMQEKLLEIVDRTKNVEEKVLGMGRRLEDRLRRRKWPWSLRQRSKWKGWK